LTVIVSGEPGLIAGGDQEVFHPKVEPGDFVEIPVLVTLPDAKAHYLNVLATLTSADNGSQSKAFVLALELTNSPETRQKSGAEEQSPGEIALPAEETVTPQ